MPSTPVNAPSSALTACELTNREATLRYWLRTGTGDRWAIFAHGAGMDHREFDRQLAVFGPAYNLLLCDLRGCGESVIHRGELDIVDVVDDFRALLELHEVDRATVVGFSFGANVAEEFAYVHPERVERLILIGWYTHHRRISVEEQLRVDEVVAQVRAQTWEDFTRYVVDQTSEQPDVRNYIVECLGKIDRERYLQMGLSRHRITREVAEEPDRRPTLLLRGEHEYDPIVEELYAGYMRANPTCRAFVIPDAGHSCHREQPAEVNRHLADFLAATEAER